MSWSGIFKEAATVGKREITVKRTAYEEADAVAIETWTDTTLFKVRGLNHLSVSGFPNMKSFHPLITELSSLLELVLVKNGLTSLPEEIGTLSKLRVLDVSGNDINVLPKSLYKLSALQTVLLSHNQLTLESFPACHDEPFPSIQYIDLVGNKLTGLPDFVYKSSSLLELKASHNVIESLLPDIGSLASLKSIEMHNNSLRDIPSELSRCSKLKNLVFDENPLADPRLRKILTQFGTVKPKAVLDYLGTKSTKGKGKKKGKGKSKHLHESDSDEDITAVHIPTTFKATIEIVRPAKFLEVKAMNSARQVRPYLVCAVVRHLNLEDDFGDHFRRFITLQTKIHDTVCKKRRTSTIATHSLSAITPPITYKSAMSHKISFCPLDWREKTTARKFLDHLRANKPDETRKAHSSGNPHSVDASASNLSRYLHMVDSNQMVYLEDSSKTVISLPPLTNSEDTKITDKSRDILIEVTSSTSLADAKMAMDALIVGMILQANLQSIPPPPPSATASSSSCSETSMAPTDTPVLIVEPVKVIDEADKLLVHYPSRNDLEEQTIQVVRPA